MTPINLKVKYSPCFLNMGLDFGGGWVVHIFYEHVLLSLNDTIYFLNGQFHNTYISMLYCVQFVFNV